MNYAKKEARDSKRFRSTSNSLVTWLKEQCPNAKTIADVGGGPGWNMEAVVDAGYDVTVYDTEDAGDYAMWTGRHHHHVTVDLSQLMSGFSADVIFCLEVWEHVPREHNAQFVTNLRSFGASTLVCSVAHVEQPGTGHINLMPKHEPKHSNRLKRECQPWVPMLVADGWVQRTDLTQTLLQKKLSNIYKPNVEVFTI